MAEECAQDIDCNGTLVCYVNVTWLEEGVASKCSCNNWEGWAGEDCLELGPGGKWLLSSATIQLVVAILGVILSVYVLARSVRMNGKLLLNALNLTTIFVGISFLLCIGWRLSVMLKVLTPELFTDVATENLFENRKEHVYKPIELTFIFFTVTFAFLATLNVSLSWVQTASDAMKLSTKGKKRVNRYRIAIITIEVIWIIIAASVWSISSALVTYLALPLLILTAITYGYGASKIVPLMRGLAASGQGSMNRYEDLIFRIRRTSYLVIIGIALASVTGIIYSSLSLFPSQGWRSVSPDGYISPVMVANDLIPASLIFVLCPILWFAYTCTQKDRVNRRGETHKGSFSAGSFSNERKQGSFSQGKQLDPSAEITDEDL